MSLHLGPMLASGAGPFDLYSALAAAAAVLGAAALGLIGDRHPSGRAPRPARDDRLDRAYHAELLTRAKAAEDECTATAARLATCVIEVGRLRDLLWTNGVHPDTGARLP